MSVIYFHHRNGHVDEIAGSERARMDVLTEKVALSGLNFNQAWGKRHWIQDLLPPGAMSQSAILDSANAPACLGSFGVKHLQYRDKIWPAWQVRGNTALLLGSDLVKLCTRIHMECESWLRIESDNRQWFAGLCERALMEHIFSPGCGWAQAIESIGNFNDSPIVMSFSGTQEFPCKDILADSEISAQDWSKMSHDRRWELGLVALRRSYPEISPGNFRTYRYGDGANFLNLEALVANTAGRK